MNKGSLTDLGIVLILAAVLITVVLFVAVFYFQFKNAVLPVDSTGASAAIFTKGDLVINEMVNLVGMVIVLVGIAAIVLAFFIPSHPIFLPISIIIWILYILLSVGFSNFLWEFINANMISTVANNYPIIVFIVQYLPHIIAVLGAAIMIVQYSKRPIA